MLRLSVLGRFYGYRHLAVESLAASLSRLRMIPGLDLTLVLALANTVVFVMLIIFLRAELARHTRAD